MMKRSNSNSRSQTGKRYSNPVNFAVIGLLFALCGDTLPSHPFAAAQNIAGKFAARTTLEQAGSSAVKKKKRAFWKQATDEDSSNTDGESTTSWKWELFLAESRMIMISIISSVACTMLSWIWYSRLGRGKDVAGEEGVEDLVCDNSKQDAGFFNSIEVGFEDVGMILKQKKRGKSDRVILDGSLRGVAKPGRMLAIMGPSGSGKSTLLHAVAGKVKEDKKVSLNGQRYVNGVPLTGDSQIPSAFIEQEVSFFPHMTVKETLDFQVELKMGAVLRTTAERDARVDELMDQAGLTKSANTIVGNTKIRGLSGGERKRLSIACEMISSPSLIFLDEPTSGLDSFQAAALIETLRKLADQGKTIVSVIHQPSQHVFGLFDDLLLLSEGRLMYFGEVSQVRQHMTDLGYGCEDEVGTAEHVLDCVSYATGAGDEAERLSLERIDTIATAAAKHAQETVVFVEGTESKGMKHIVDKAAAHPGTNILRQFKLLLGRSVQELLRGKAAILIKIVQQVSLGAIYGGIYTLGENQASIMDRFGLLSLIIIGATNMAMAGTVRSFPKEKAIVSTEMASHMYRTGPYFIAKAISEIPLIVFCQSIFGAIIYPLVKLQKGRFKRFLGLISLHSIASEAFGLLIGSVSSSSDTALALFPPIIILNIIFDGKNIAEENTPKLLKWVNKVGLIRWGFTGLALNEFDGLAFTSSGPFRGPVAKTGQEALARFGLDGQSVGNVVSAQTKIIAGCWMLSYLGLALTKQKFAEMKSPSK